MSIEDSIKRLREALAAGPLPAPRITTSNALNDGGYYIAACSPEVLAYLLAALDEREALREDVKLWRGLYRRAVNEANGLTNYVEDRPELRRAERNLTAIEAEARAARKEPT